MPLLDLFQHPLPQPPTHPANLGFPDIPDPSAATISLKMAMTVSPPWGRRQAKGVALGWGGWFGWLFFFWSRRFISFRNGKFKKLKASGWVLLLSWWVDHINQKQSFVSFLFSYSLVGVLFLNMPKLASDAKSSGLRCCCCLASGLKLLSPQIHIIQIIHVF